MSIVDWEVSGRVVQVFFEGFRDEFENEKLDRLASKGLERVDRESWYAYGGWFDVLDLANELITESIVDDFEDPNQRTDCLSRDAQEIAWKRIGEAVLRSSGLLEDEETILGAISTIGTSYRCFHRPNTGNLSCRTEEDDSVHIYSETVYPCPLNRGICEMVTTELTDGKPEIEERQHKDRDGRPTQCWYVVSR